MDQVQGAACVRTQAYDIAGVRRDFRLIENNVEQREELDPDG
jgi:hypothetical protein